MIRYVDWSSFAMHEQSDLSISERATWTRPISKRKTDGVIFRRIRRLKGLLSSSAKKIELLSLNTNLFELVHAFLSYLANCWRLVCSRIYGTFFCNRHCSISLPNYLRRFELLLLSLGVEKNYLSQTLPRWFLTDIGNHMAVSLEANPPEAYSTGSFGKDFSSSRTFVLGLWFEPRKSRRFPSK